MTTVAKLIKTVAKPTATPRSTAREAVPAHDAGAENFQNILAETSAAMQKTAEASTPEPEVAKTEVAKTDVAKKEESPELSAPAEAPEATEMLAVAEQPVVIEPQPEVLPQLPQAETSSEETMPLCSDKPTFEPLPTIIQQRRPERAKPATTPDAVELPEPELPPALDTQAKRNELPLEPVKIERLPVTTVPTESAPETEAVVAEETPKENKQAPIAEKPVVKPVEPRNRGHATSDDRRDERPDHRAEVKMIPPEHAASVAGLPEQAADTAHIHAAVPNKTAEMPAASPAPTPITTDARPTPAPVIRAETASPAQETPQIDRENVFDQVVLGLRSKVDAKNGKAEIRLDPPNLGVLHVSVELTNGQLSAEFKSGSALVRNLLSSNMEKLKSTLESQGVTVDRIAVNTTPGQEKVQGTVAQPTSASQFSQHDGRSAGGFGREQNQQRRSNGDNFQRIWQEQLDLVA